MSNPAPISIMEIKKVHGKNEICNNLDDIGKVLLHPDVKDRNIVVLSIIGALRTGKSFFLDYCLRFMYANVSDFNNIAYSIKYNFYHLA